MNLVNARGHGETSKTRSCSCGYGKEPILGFENGFEMVEAWDDGRRWKKEGGTIGQ